MPDISMCSNTTCVINQTCYRFTATPCEYRQSYSEFSHTEENPCGYYWDNDFDKVRPRNEKS